MAFRILNSVRVQRILQALSPRFIGRDQDHLLALADEAADAGYSAAYDYVQPLYDFKGSLESAAGSDLIGFKLNETGASERTVYSKLSEVISVKDFGAVGDGVTDDTEALNAAFEWLRNNLTAEFRPAYLDGNNGVYLITGSINATNIATGRNWGVRNLTINAKCAGKTAMDLIGSRFGHFIDVHIYGDQTDTPHTGILLCAKDLGAGAVYPMSHCLFDNVSVDGYFLSSGLHMRSAEEHLFNGCRFWNRRIADGNGESWAAILDGSGYKAVVSDFATPAAAGQQSFTVNKFSKCSFQKPFGIIGPTVFMQDAASITFSSCYLTNGGGTGIVWRLTSFVPYRIFMDFQQETTNTDRFINFTSDAAATREIRGLHCTFGNSYCDSEVFSYDTLTGLTLNSFKCHLYRQAGGVSLANGLFEPSSAITIRDADIVVPLLSNFDGVDAFAGFTGKVVSMDGARAIYPPTAQLLAQSSAAVSHTGTTTETTLATIVVPAKTMGKNGRLRITTLWSMTNNANAKGLRVRFGGVLYNSQTATSSLSSRYVTEVANRNSESIQVGPSTGTIGIGNSGLAVVNSAVDTTVAQNIAIQCLLTNAGDTVTLESYTIEVIPVA